METEIFKHYTKKPFTIQAIEWTGKNQTECKLFCSNVRFRNGGQMLIQTLEGDMFCNEGDYIIKGVKGEFYPCKPDIFQLTYEQSIAPNREIEYPDEDDCESIIEGILENMTDTMPDDITEAISKALKDYRDLTEQLNRFEV